MRRPGLSQDVTAPDDATSVLNPDNRLGRARSWPLDHRRTRKRTFKSFIYLTVFLNYQQISQSLLF